jgi:small subunit ribosomal protein S11
MAKKIKKVRKNVVRGIAHVKATQNNTLVTITDMNGETVCWDSAGTIGFKGARKSTPFAATRAGESAAQKARKIGMSEVEVRIRGSGAGRESAVNGIVSTGIRVTAIEDHTPVPHNGCRPAKRRRV